MQATESRKATVRCASCGKLNRVDVARAKDRPKCGHCGKPIALDRPLVLGDADFDRLVADAQVPVLVDFYADWCGPCKIMAPVLDQFARDRAGGLLVAKVDTDANPVVSRRFGISSIPTLILFRGGREAGRELGAIPRPRLDALVGPPLA
ncbi:MAG TPA: thioredoxin [Longimicrobiaceae bacterium]|jgi:thioredoxin 2|nr:thioredoxin [Longimicrobiaceae bacterium]